MRRQNRHKWLLRSVFIIAAVCAPAEKGFAQTGPSCDIPQEVATSKDLSLFDVASLLAKQGCSGGVVLSDQENWPHPEIVKGMLEHSQSASVPVTTAFSSQAKWRVARKRSGVFHLAPATSNACEAILQRRLERVDYAGKAFEFESAIHALLKGEQPYASGKVPKVGRLPTALEQGGFDVWQQQVSLSLVDVTVEQVLDETVAQVPGLFWVMREARISPESAGCYLDLRAAASGAQKGENLLSHKLALVSH